MRDGARDAASCGVAMHDVIAELYPICRSITGNGLRQTLQRVAELIPLELREVASGTPVFDWVVPREWNIRDAYVKNSRGERVIDFAQSNLHVLNYSVPVRGTFTLDELKKHLYSLPDRPRVIPYRTSYYQERWGFCLSHEQLERLPPDRYEVCIDSTLAPGHLTYGECVLPGESEDEILISSHSCHPSLCNDNLSGVVVAAFLAREMAARRRKHTFRFLFIPGTIGSIVWLARNQEAAHRIRHGLVLTCVGDSGRPSYKRSRRGDALIDRAAQHVLTHTGDHEIIDFFPYGYDERQYCSPGFNLAVGALSRTPGGRFPEYHTSADNLEFVRPEALEASLATCLDICEVLEGNGVYVNTNPFCEPQLGKRGLYQGVGGSTSLPGFELALLWVLNLSDGAHTLLDIAERAKMPFRIVRQAADALETAGLLTPVADISPNTKIGHEQRLA